MPNEIPNEIPNENGQRIYEIARECLGAHITLDSSVPSDVGCAEAVSYVLKNALGDVFPAQGFASTNLLWQWLKTHFTQVSEPIIGDVVISPTGTSAIGSPHGHVGIIAKYGILSNSSDTGLFSELWTITKWNKYYNKKLGFPVYFFRAP